MPLVMNFQVQDLETATKSGPEFDVKRDASGGRSRASKGSNVLIGGQGSCHDFRGFWASSSSWLFGVRTSSKNSSAYLDSLPESKYLS